MRSSTPQQAALKRALRQLATGATQFLAVMEAIDLPRTVNHGPTVASRIRHILLAKGPLAWAAIRTELANDGHRRLTGGCVGGTLNTMRKGGFVTNANGVWHLVAAEQHTAEFSEPES